MDIEPWGTDGHKGPGTQRASTRVIRATPYIEGDLKVLKTFLDDSSSEILRMLRT